VVGITGTNGKSTTTALVHHILKTAGVPTTMGGNIGLPILAQDPLPEGGVYVLELSSFQIDLTRASTATSRCCSTSRPIIWIATTASRLMRRRRRGCLGCNPKLVGCLTLQLLRH
jgi:UDP-N-acetylmuramoylalanine-D-glutamate ligase